METFGRDWDAKAKEFFFVRFALVVEREREVLVFCNFVFLLHWNIGFSFFFFGYSLQKTFSENKFQFPSSLKRCKDVRSHFLFLFSLFMILLVQVL